MDSQFPFFTFACELAASLSASGYYSRSKNCFAALQSVFRFYDDRSLPLKTFFSHDFLHNYECFLAHTGCVRNTISFYMGVLRSIYRQAVHRKLLLPVDGLFDGVFTGFEPTVKRAVDSRVVALIMAGDLSAKPRLEVCRDYFLLSLYLQGMPFIDLAHLRKCDIQDGLLVYWRRKTKGVVQVALLPEAIALINKYAGQTEDSPYVLPLLTESGAAGFRQYTSVLHRQNRQLKELALYLGIHANLTTYVARHCWATFAYHGGANVGVVSQGMGHHTEKVTRTYLSSFGRSELEYANCIVLNAILSPIACGEIEDVDEQMRMRIIERVKEMSKYLGLGSGEKKMSQRWNGRVEKTGVSGHVMNIGNSGNSGRTENTITRRLGAPQGDSVRTLK